jgi:hypothetical protein
MGSPWLETVSKVVPFISAFGRRRRMRRHLYKEISENYQRLVIHIYLCTSVTGLSQGAPFRFTEKLDISFDAWNFYNGVDQRHFLFELKEAASIGRIYEKFIAIGNGDIGGYAIVRGREAAAEVDERLLDGSLDRKLYKEVSTPDAWHTMDELLSGKRSSWRRCLNPI